VKTQIERWLIAPTNGVPRDAQAGDRRVARAMAVGRTAVGARRTAFGAGRMLGPSARDGAASVVGDVLRRAIAIARAKRARLSGGRVGAASAKSRPVGAPRALASGTPGHRAFTARAAGATAVVAAECLPTGFVSATVAVGDTVLCHARVETRVGAASVALRLTIGQGEIRGVVGNALTLEMIGAAIRDESERCLAMKGGQRFRRALAIPGRAVGSGNGPSAHTDQRGRTFRSRPNALSAR
jgi:hypothetical protein